jgi:hypothetical protein
MRIFHRSLLIASALLFTSQTADSLRVNDVTYLVDTGESQDTQIKIIQFTLTFDEDVFAYLPNLGVRFMLLLSISLTDVLRIR